MKFFLLLIALFSLISGTSIYAANNKISEKEMSDTIKKIKQYDKQNRAIRFSNEFEDYATQIQREKWKLRNVNITEISGIYSPDHSLLICNSNSRLGFAYGELEEVQKLTAAYILLTGEPFPIPFEPKSIIYIKAKGKIGYETGSYYNAKPEPSFFFLTELLDYSADKNLIKDCEMSRSKNKYTPIPQQNRSK